MNEHQRIRTHVLASLHFLLKKLYVAQSGVLQTLDGLQKVLIIRHDCFTWTELLHADSISHM